MGSFSFMKADTLTNTANIVFDRPFKFLIPEPFATGEFACGYIKDKYQDYGLLDYKKDKNGYPMYDKPRFDMHELLAIWNADRVVIRQYTTPDGKYTIDEDEYDNLERFIDVALQSQKDGFNLSAFDKKYIPLKDYKKEDYTVHEKRLADVLKGDISNPMKEIDEFTDFNRGYGIDLFFANYSGNKDIYHLKLVSCSFRGRYEQCQGISLNDPEQGYIATKRVKKTKKYR